MRPKIDRGCFQCSRRRIICDKSEPSCLKCAKKGIECSGLSRIRFAEGAARRGRFKDSKVPKVRGDDTCQELPTTISFQTLRWADDHKIRKRRRINIDEVTTGIRSTTLSEDFPKVLVDGTFAQRSTETTKTDLSVVEDIGRGHRSLVARCMHTADIARWISPIDPQARMLFSYC